MSKPTLATIRELERVIGRLETWERRHAMQHDTARRAGHAKTQLIDLLRDLEHQREARHE